MGQSGNRLPQSYMFLLILASSATSFMAVSSRSLSGGVRMAMRQ